MPAAIREFRGEFRFLSNFYVERDGLTVEHRFQAMKTLDPELAQEILRAPDPQKAKRLGRRVVLRPDWEDVKVVIMSELVGRKFFTDRELALRLHMTGHAALYEGNTWQDLTWGVDVDTGKGSNLLGTILMATRTNLRLAGKVPNL